MKLELSNPDNKKLLSNFISLAVLQTISFVLPLLVIPYLIYTVGIEKFGIVSLAQAIITYFIVFTDYGFNLTATRDISLNRDNLSKIQTIFNSVLATKLLLGFVSLVLLTILIFIVPKLKEETPLYYYSFSLVLGQLLFPIWFFQGIEKMKFITYLNVFAKLFFTGLIFILIKKPEDYIYINLYQGVGNLLSGIISIIFICYKFQINLFVPNIVIIKAQLKKGWAILLSNLSINVYINSNIIILGFFVNSVILGYYSIAEKIMFALRQLLVVFSQVIYPHVCKLTINGHEELKKFYKRLFIPFFFLIFICCTLLFVFSEQIVLIISGQHIEQISILVKLLSIVPIIVCLNIPAYQTLLAYNLKKSYSLVLTFGSLLSICLNLILSSYYNAIGTAITIIITEITITTGLFLFLEFKHRQYSILRKTVKKML